MNDTQTAETIDTLETLDEGDRVLWDDRVEPMTVARVVDEDDEIGQTLTASVMSRTPNYDNDRTLPDREDMNRPLRKGDVFLSPFSWKTLASRTFVVVQGTQGGFYAVAYDNDRDDLVMFRAIRSYHETKAGHRGQGAFRYEKHLDEFRKVGEGDTPDELDPDGDLPTYEEVEDNPVVAYDREVGEHYEVATVSEVFDEGLTESHERARTELRERVGYYDEARVEDEDDTLDLDRVESSPDEYDHGSVVEVVEIFEDEYDTKRAVVETPAPWEVRDDVTPPNDVIKSTPWSSVHYEFDDSRKAWVVDASELVALSAEFSQEGYTVRVEDEVEA